MTEITERTTEYTIFTWYCQCGQYVESSTNPIHEEDFACRECQNEREKQRQQNLLEEFAEYHSAIQGGEVAEIVPNDERVTDTEQHLSYLGALQCVAWWLTGDLPEATPQDILSMVTKEIELPERQVCLEKPKQSQHS